jgi:flavin reductase (DIM6/NTAB) family NADH-FMN oxidoreductase RutF
MTSKYISNAIIEAAVGIVLIRAGETCNAMTVSCYSEVAHHPTALWVSIAKTSFTHSLLSEQPQFSLAVLNQKQGDIALRCGTISGRDHNKCSSLDLYMTSAGFLFLNNALASTSCRIRNSVDLDEHTLFIADILETQLESRKSHLRQLLLSDLERYAVAR